MAPSSPVPAAEGEPADLSELTLEELMQVEVTTASKAAESPFEAPGIISIVTAEEIRRFGARTVQALLNRVTGIYLYGSYFYPTNRLSLRGDLAGHYDNHVLVLINGRPFRDSMYDGLNMNFYQAFPVSAIDHIEVIRGPGSALYGTDAFVGVINVITRKGDDQGAAATAGGGSFGTVYSDASYGLGRDDSDLKASIAVGYHKERGWEYTATDETIGPSVANKDSDYMGSERFGGYVNLSYKEFSIDAFLSHSENDMLGVLPIWPMQKIDDHQRYFVDGQWSHAFLENLSLTTNVTYNFQEFDFRMDDPGPANHIVTSRANSLLGEISSRFSPFESVHLTGGVVADYKWGHQDNTGGLPDDIPSYSDLWWSGYFQAIVDTIDRVRLIGGVQWNKTPGRPSHWVPRTGVVVSITDRIGLKALYGQAYRAPSAFERDVNAPGIILGNPDLDPETAQTLEAELNYHSEGIQASLSYYYTLEDDLIIRSGTGPTPQNFNQGELTIQGIEFDWKYAVTKELYLTGSYRYQWNKDDETTDVTLVPNHMFKIGASYSSPQGFLIGAFYSFLSQPEHLDVFPVNPDPKAWHLLELNLELDVNPLMGMEIPFDPIIKIRGTNLANQKMDFPEFVRRNLNSLPQAGGAAGFADLTLRF
jgi:outer membrane receptor protein involved in Fe transport